jgi:tetratricopeptide (TPR) repeat protein
MTRTKNHKTTITLLILSFLISGSCAAQNSRATQEAIQSPCANDTVAASNATSVTIKCTGLTPEQQKLLRNIPDLLNKVLSTQKNDTYQILGKLDSCIDDAAVARRSASAAIRGITTTYSFDGGFIRTISHENGGTQESSEYKEAPPEYYQMNQLQQQKKWQELIELCDRLIKAKPEWLTPYLAEGTAYLNLGQTEKAVPLLKYVRDESGGSSEYAQAGSWLKQLGY